MRRLRLAISQIGVGRSRHLPEPRDMILEPSDVGPGWKVLDQRRWRTGVSREPWAERARALGGVTAWRSFKHASGRRWLWVQATPLVNDRDAEAALTGFHDRTLENLRAKVTVTATHDAPALVLPASTVKAVEQQTTGSAGPGAARYVAWAHRGVFSALAGSAFGDPWSWDSLQDLAQKQNERIDAVLRD